ncbi:MAG: hypothetical protein QHJ34_13200 [bacterium]|jgi:hypothetical protein|nr:hypothetical protein [candidate division KSB1 bacterium]MDH7561169.1 hypothetical protein [bacterium]
MVDINLLGDEEPQKPRRPEGEYESYRFEEMGPGGEERSAHDWGEPSPLPEFDEEEPRKRRSWAPWLVFFLFAAVTLAVVFLVWRPFGRRPAPVAVAPTQPPVDTTGASAHEPPTASTLPQCIENLLTSLPSGAVLRGLSYTSGRFYLEVGGGAQGDVQTYADGLKRMLAEGSVAVHRRGERALLVGTLEGLETSGQPLGLKSVAPDALQSLLRHAAQSLDLRVLRLSGQRRTKLAETYHTPFQLMMEGKLSAVPEFLHQLEDSGVAVQLTKLVITPVSMTSKQPGLVRIVLHLDLLESS